MALKTIIVGALVSSGVVMAAPFEGLYATGSLKKGEMTPMSLVYIVDAHDGVWVASPLQARLAKRDALKLTPPAAGKPWQLTLGARTYARTADPFLARIMGRLKGKLTLEGVGADGHKSDEKLTLVDGIYFRNEMPSAQRMPTCISGYLAHDPTWNRERPFDAQPKQPAKGKVAVRLFDAFAIEDCPAALDASGENKPHEMMGAQLYARDDGEVLAVQIVAYMYTALYVRPGLPPALMAELQRAAADEAGRQAE